MTPNLPAANRTVAEQTYDTLKGDLLSGAFAPGSALLTRELLARYGCGISPLREAIARLVGEGLLAASGHRGVRVPLPTVGDLNEIYRIRTLLECDALRLAMEHGDDQWEAEIVAACHRLERAPLPAPGVARGPIVIAWEERHRAFHEALIAAAGAPRLLRIIAQLNDQTERYRAIRLTKVDRTKLARDVAAEHRALADAVVARDGQALALLADHLERTRAFVALVLVGSA
jgi:GntR family transcriptional regulator, carbon starvation induced regulator